MILITIITSFIISLNYVKSKPEFHLIETEVVIVSFTLISHLISLKNIRILATFLSVKTSSAL